MHSEATDVENDDSVAPEGISRRSFLQLCPVMAATVATAVHPRAAQAQTMPAEVTELAEKHAQDPGLLIDLTKCIGCGKCVAACKEKNDLPTRADQPAEGPDAALASSNYSIVQAEKEPNGQVVPVKRQCMHCLEPACASVCFMKALTKTDAGPVVYDPNRCIGCRYCLMACPFGVPAFDWDATMARVTKCNLCVDRTSVGKPTACADACPTGTVTFGKRGDLLQEAHRRIDEQPGTYVSEVYGESTVGGTSVLYVSDIPFEDLGFPKLGEEPLPSYTWQITRLIPPAAAGLGTVLVALYLRRRKLLDEDREDATYGGDER